MVLSTSDFEKLRYALISDFAQSLSEAAGLDALKADTLSKLKYIIDFNRCTLALLNKDESSYRLLTLLETRQEMPRTTEEKLPLESGIHGNVIRNGEPCICGDLPWVSEVPAADASIEGGSLNSTMCLPLQVEGKTFGSIAFCTDQKVGYKRADINMASTIATHLSLAIDRWNLIQKLSTTNEEVQNLNTKLEERVEGRTADLRKEINERKRTEAALRESEARIRTAYEEIKQLENQLTHENIYLQEEIRTEHNFEEIVGKSRELKRVLKRVELVAPTDSSILITGETGTGKELIARAIHHLSKRKDRPLIKVNCAALPTGLIESELFGHEKGAFTGALSKKVGRFELAHQGTIFLDEIGDLLQEVQVNLLRVLQEQEFERVGGTKTIKVDVRVIAATNRELEKAVAENRFRADLYYRLNVFPLPLPSLRERGEDIPLLVQYFVDKYATKTGKQIDAINQETMRRLRGYPWPGNIRELENVIERSIILSSGSVLEIEDEFLLPSSTLLDQKEKDTLTLQEVERNHIMQILDKTGWVIDGPQGAAKILNLHPNTLRGRMKKLGIERVHLQTQ